MKIPLVKINNSRKNIFPLEQFALLPKRFVLHDLQKLFKYREPVATLATGSLYS